MSGTELDRLERDLGVSLGIWGLGSTVAGTIQYLRGRSPGVRAFGGQTAGWGAIDLVISAVAHFRARKSHRPEPSKRRRTLRLVLAVNTLLDVGYVSGGLALVNRADRYAARSWVGRWRSASELRGDGIAVVIQGGFLLLLDGVTLLRVQRLSTTES